VKEKIFLPIIDNGGGLSRTSWAACMFALGLALRKDNYSIVAQGVSYPYPDGAMNVSTNDFLKSGADRMVVIDTDIIFKPVDVERLLSHDIPFVGGIYPKKKVGLELVVEPLNGTNPFASDPFAEGVEPLVEVKRVARGFINVHRSVFESMLASGKVESVTGNENIKHVFWRLLPGGHSEDFAFCDAMREIGIKVMVDQRVLLKHEGSAVYPIKGTY
jgi:hypothetical protein